MKRYKIDWDGLEVFKEVHKYGEWVKYSDVEGLIEDYKNLQSLYEEEINLAQHQRGRKLFINDEKIIQKQRKALKLIHHAGYNTLKSIVSDQFGPDRTERIIRDAEDRAREALKKAGVEC